jgi:hypothetical protein
LTVLTPLRLAAVTGALAGLLVAVCAVGLGAGPSALSPREVASALLGAEPSGAAGDIVLRVRLPRVLLAALVGASLAVAGAIFQALLRNPLADPFVLGVSGGAALGGIAALSLGGSLGWGYAAVPPAAFAGAFATAILLFGLGGDRLPGLAGRADRGREHLPLADREPVGGPGRRGALGRAVPGGGPRLCAAAGAQPEPAHPGRRSPWRDSSASSG